MTAARELQGVGAGTITDSGTVPGRSPSGLRLLGSPAFSGGGVTTGGCVVAEDGSGSRSFTYSPNGATQVAGMRRRVGEQKDFSFSARVDAFPVSLTNGMAIDALPRCRALLRPALPTLSRLTGHQETVKEKPIKLVPLGRADRPGRPDLVARQRRSRLELPGLIDPALA